MIPLFVFGLYYIPIGIFIGNLVGSIAYLLFYVAEEKEYLRNSFKISILINVIRFILIAIIAFVFALLEYVYFIKVANIFAILGGYLIPLVVYIIVLLKRREK